MLIHNIGTPCTPTKILRYTTDIDRESIVVREFRCIDVEDIEHEVTSTEWEKTHRFGRFGVRLFVDVGDCKGD